MKATRGDIPGLILFEPQVFRDNRGFFFESFNQLEFEQATGLCPAFVQDNHSMSTKGVLRGLHYQLAPYAQGKLVRVVSGAVFDVAVDIRKNSPTFGRWLGEVLSSENNKQLWVPPGFAHGFVTLSDEAVFLYKTTDYYVPNSERCIAWNDPDIGVLWPQGLALQLSLKDQQGVPLGLAEVFEEGMK